MAVMSIHLPIADLPFRDVMAERLGLPVVRRQRRERRDARRVALRRRRAARATAAMLTLGTGIGGGLVVGGALQRGSQGAGAELGHMVVEADGPPCPGNCPNRGCLEAMASGNALGREALRIAARAAGLRPRPGARGRARDQRPARDRARPRRRRRPRSTPSRSIGRWLGVGICNLVNMLNPDVVVIGGGVIAAGELLLEPSRAVVAERALSPSREHVRIVPARFGAESGMLGAAVLALDGIAGPA